MISAKNNDNISKTTMTSCERLEAAFKGEKVDRVPIWPREGFFPYRPLPDSDDFSCGWMADPLYRELYDYMEPHMDFLLPWGCTLLNRMLMIPSKNIKSETVKKNPDNQVMNMKIKTQQKALTMRIESNRGTNTRWVTKHAVDNIDDLKALAEVDFSIEKDLLGPSLEGYKRALSASPERGIPQLFMSSPIVTISGTMPFELFLELSLLEKEWFHELLQKSTDRILKVLETLFELEDIKGVFTLGGSEQCTPPMMSPHSFDEFVVPYDKQIIDFLHSKGCLVNIHCHGKVRHALGQMIEMGADGTEPVEPAPDGVVTYAEAREIAGDKLTLLGNIEFNDFEHKTPADIRQSVKDILKHGNRRLILTNSAGPIEKITQKMADNYRAWVDAALEFGY